MPPRHLDTSDSSLPFLDSEFAHDFGDDDFDRAFPASVQEVSRCHWTPIEVGRKAAQFLVRQPGTRVLDVGCGPGKFCAVGAATTEGHFTGVEQRGRLVSTAKRMLCDYGISRVDIIHANVVDLSFEPFDGFYLYNPFQENVFPAQCIDLDVELDSTLYHTYSNYVRMQLSQARKGTRAVTYWGNHDEIPPSYDCVESHFDGKLKFWIKKRPNPMLPLARIAAPGARQGERAPHVESPFVGMYQSPSESISTSSL